MDGKTIVTRNIQSLRSYNNLVKSGWTNQSLDTHTAWWRTDHEEHTGGITRTDFKAMPPVAPHQTKEIHSPEKRQEIDRERRVEERKQEEGQQTDHGNQAVFCPLLFKHKCYYVILLFSLICVIYFISILTLSQGQSTIFKSLKPPLFRVWGLFHTIVGINALRGRQIVKFLTIQVYP